MSAFENDRPIVSSVAITIGEDLSLLSVEELEERITACEKEIERIRSELAAKKSSLAAAQDIFKK